MAVLAPVDLVAHPVFHAGGAGGAPLVVVRLVAVDLGLGPLVRLPRFAAKPVHRCGGVGLRDLEPAPGSGRPGSNDSGLSGRVYSMFAEQMSRTSNRGRIIWVMASSRRLASGLVNTR